MAGGTVRPDFRPRRAWPAQARHRGAAVSREGGQEHGRSRSSAKTKPRASPEQARGCAQLRPRRRHPRLPLIDIDIPIAPISISRRCLTTLQTPPDSDGGWYGLRQRFAHLGLAQGFDELLCLPQLHGIETFWYQVETVRKVLKQFRGRVLLADEVGLGKTIEAGMVLKEYLLRGMVEQRAGADPGVAGRAMAGGDGDQVRYCLRDHP